MCLESVGVEDGCLEHSSHLMRTLQANKCTNGYLKTKGAISSLRMPSDNMLSSSLGLSANLVAPVIRDIIEYNYSSLSLEGSSGFIEHPPTQVQTEETDINFHSEHSDKYLVNLRESSKLVMLDVRCS